MNPKPFSRFFFHTDFFRDRVCLSGRLGGILVQHAVKCVYVAHAASAGWKLETFLVARRGGGFPAQLIKCLEMQRQAFFFFVFSFSNQTLKQKERGTLYESRPVSAAGSNFTSSSLEAVLHFRSFLLLLISSHPNIHSFVLYTVHCSISCLSTCWEHVKSLHFSKKPKFSFLVVLLLLLLLSSICRPWLCFKSMSINKKRSTMLAYVTGTHRWLHCARERGWGLETGTCRAKTQYVKICIYCVLVHILDKNGTTLSWTHAITSWWNSNQKNRVQCIMYWHVCSSTRLLCCVTSLEWKSCLSKTSTVYELW